MLVFYLSVLDDPDDKKSFEKLYYDNRQKMYAIAYSILNNSTDAEDAVEETFFKIANNFTEISQKDCKNLNAYIVIICRNTAINMYNSNKRETVIDEEAAEEIVDPEYFEQADYEELYAAIKMLPQKYKDTIYLFDLMGLSGKATADALNIKENAVNQRVKRARQMLRQILEAGDFNERK